MQPMWYVSMKNKANHIGFHYLLADLKLHFLILLELAYFARSIKQKKKDGSITHNIFRIQDSGSIMCRFYCIPAIEYMFAGKIC